MDIEIDTVKIEMTKIEVQALRNEILELINSHPMIAGEDIRIHNPKINEFITILEIDLEKIPF